MLCFAKKSLTFRTTGHTSLSKRRSRYQKPCVRQFSMNCFSELLQILYVDSLTDVVALWPWARNL